MRLEMEELRAVRDLRAGDETAMAWFMDRHGALVWRICRAILSSDADAEEAWQDTYLKLWLKIGKWNPDRGSLAAWLARIARHSAIDAHRRLKRRREVLLFAYDDDDPLTRSADVRPLPDAVAEQSEFCATVTSATDHIRNPNHRMAFVMRHMEGLSIREIAWALDAKPVAAKVWACRGAQALARVLAARRFRKDH
jgi:RNA polymerase sigma-70 factor (ECF subfamily)